MINQQIKQWIENERQVREARPQKGIRHSFCNSCGQNFFDLCRDIKSPSGHGETCAYCDGELTDTDYLPAANNYKSLLDALETAVEALEFYGDKRTWLLGGEDFRDRIHETDCDKINIGGDKARKALSDIGVKLGGK